MEYQRFEEWRQAHFVSYMPKINLYSISGLEPGEHEFVGVIINLDKDGNVTVLDKNVDKTVKLDDNLESIDTNKAEENDKISSDEQTKTDDESKTEKEQDKKTETKNVKIKDDDYIIVTGKDGSITIVTKLPLNSAMGLKIKNSLIASGKITDKTIINFMTLKANGETVIGNSTLTVNNEGVLGIIGDDFKDVEALYDSEVASYLNARLNKDENGHLDGNKEKPDHNEPTPEPDKPTPEPDKPTPEPDKPTPEPNKPTPEPSKPTPEPSKPVTTPKTEISKKLPQTGDVADPSLAGVLATSGVIALASGVALAKDKKKNGKDDGTFDRWETMTGPDDDINKKFEEIIGHKGKHFSNETKGQIIETEQNHKKRFFR